MLKYRTRLALIAVALAVPVTSLLGDYSRVTPLVEAIRKVEPSVIGIMGPKGDKVKGTGIIIDKRGVIVTNHHVVGKAKEVIVLLRDGTKVKGQVVVDRPELDLAFVTVSVKNDLPAIPPMKTGDVLLGESVIAIGHPLGYTNTVSAGIVSSLGREIELPSGSTLTNLIQTNAAINPGNSGGPLLNINGELIGINCAVRADAQGIAFSIHCLTVLKALNEVRK
jgi:serine protease Do